MKRRSFVLALLCVFAAVCCVIEPSTLAVAEYAVGKGAKFKEATRTASAELNKALSSIHLMMSAVDLNDVVAAEKYKKEAAEQLKAAANLYEKATTYAGSRQLNPIPSTGQEKLELEYYETSRASRGIKEPLTETTAVIFVVGTLRDAAKYLEEKVDVKVLPDDVAGQQAFSTYFEQLLAFLNSLTTVLRTG